MSKLDERTGFALQTKDERGESRENKFTCFHDRADQSYTEGKDERLENCDHIIPAFVIPDPQVTEPVEVPGSPYAVLYKSIADIYHFGACHSGGATPR